MGIEEILDKKGIRDFDQLLEHPLWDSLSHDQQTAAYFLLDKSSSSNIEIARYEPLIHYDDLERKPTNEESETYVALVENRAVGYIEVLHSQDSTFIRYLYVNKSSRRAGIAHHLMARIDFGQQLCGLVDKENTSALEFDLRYGFRVSGVFDDDHFLVQRDALHQD